MDTGASQLMVLEKRPSVLAHNSYIDCVNKSETKSGTFQRGARALCSTTTREVRPISVAARVSG